MQPMAKTREVHGIIAFGVLVSMLTAILSAIFADVSAQVILASGMIGIVLVLQIELILRVVRRAEFDDVLMHFLIRVLRAPDLAPSLVLLAKRIVEINEMGTHPAVKQLSHRILNDSLRQFRRLQSGQIVLDDSDPTLMAEEIQDVGSSIHATTFPAEDHLWWTSPGGQSYLEANERAVARGSVVERIFIYENWTPDIQRLAEDQISRGILIYRVNRREIRPQLVRKFVLYDRKFLVEDEVNVRGEVTGYLHAIDSVTVDDAFNSFCSLRTFAAEVEVEA